MNAPHTTRVGFARQAESLFEALREVPPTQLVGLLKFSYTRMMTKRSKIFINNLLKDVFATTEPRLLVISGHLYFDYILLRMLDREHHTLNKRQVESFHAKLEFLYKVGRFDSDTYNCLIAVNRLRNSFAHNIFYDLSNWDARSIPYVQRYDLSPPRRKHLLQVFNILVLRLSFMVEIMVLSDQNKWLYGENMPKS